MLTEDRERRGEVALAAAGADGDVAAVQLRADVRVQVGVVGKVM
ncbi:hypothetical protein [uncultured Microbacterium sp.]|nr:hypothetical protein [uncultured Microbacterium sp.]